MGKTSAKSETEKSSKAERKFEKKLQFYKKVRNVADASLSAKTTISKKSKVRSRQKKLKAYDLSNLSEFLPELKAKQPNPVAEFKLNCKSRQKLLLKEGKQLNTVLNHAAFKSDPLAAIHQHLQSTQPVFEEKPKKKQTKNGSKKKKGGKSKASSEPQSMDI